MELIEKHASFGGWQNVYRHYSQSLKCEMNVGVYLPPKAANEKLPVLYWLSGLTCNELPDLVMQHFPATTRKSISGHSMGGLGALVLALRNPDEYVSVSAFSPIVSPSQVPWGQQAFAAYLGENKDAWLDYDPVSLISQGQRVAEIMVDQGLSDDFYAEQLRTPNLEKICQEMNIKTLIRYHEGYDHSYYFVSSFIGEHIAYHANKLNMR